MDVFRRISYHIVGFTVLLSTRTTFYTSVYILYWIIKTRLHTPLDYQTCWLYKLHVFACKWKANVKYQVIYLGNSPRRIMICKCSLSSGVERLEKTYIMSRASARSDQSLYFPHEKKCILGYPKCVQQRFWSDCTKRKWAGWSLLGERPKVRFLTLRLKYKH